MVVLLQPGAPSHISISLDTQVAETYHSSPKEFWKAQPQLLLRKEICVPGSPRGKAAK